MFTLRWFLPIYPKAFINRSMVFGVVVLLWHIPWYAGIMEFTMLEILLIGTLGIWILHFYEQTIQVVQDIVGADMPKSALVDSSVDEPEAAAE